MLIKNITLCLAMCLLAACSNAVSYHHSERSSIALEARTTDPQQPIQGIIGIKTRTVVVTPGINSKGNNGESTSVISDFKLTRAPSDDFFGFGSTKIQSAFITGKAAKDAPASSAKALSGLPIVDTGDSVVLKRSIMKDIFRLLKDNKQTDKVANAHVESLNQLKRFLPDNYKDNTYYQMESHCVKKKDKENFMEYSTDLGFLEVIDYEQKLLTNSIVLIESFLSQPEIKYLKDGDVECKDIDNISHVDFAMLQEELKRLKKEKTEYDKLLNHTSIDAAISYVTRGF